MPGGTRQIQLWKALDNHSSLYELSFELARLGRSLHTDPHLAANGVRIGATVQTLWMDASSNWEVLVLLHAMNRSVIRAIILGTVAYEAFHNRLSAYPEPTAHDKHAQGIYVVGLNRLGYSGKFLNDIELRQLIRGLDRYIQGCRVLWRVTDPAQQDPDERQLAQWVAHVDAAYSSTNRAANAIALAHPTKARYVADESKVASIEAFVSSLRKRLLPSGCRHSATATTARHIQSPLYVGCSTNLTARLANYKRTQHLTSVNRPLALTISVLSALGLTVSWSAHVVLRTWKASQLSQAEQLVVTLANSLIHQTGFNSIPGGDNPGSNAGTERAEALVLGDTRGPLQENLQNSEADRQDRLQFETDLEDFDTDLEYTDSIREECDTMVPALQPYQLTSAADVIRLTEAELRSLRQERDEIRQAQKTASFIWSAYKAAAPEVCQRVEAELEAKRVNKTKD